MRHSVSNVKAQSGQAIVLIALMMIGLMGVLGMAIDGGGLYFLHRDTQNAVDAALVAALYAKCAGNRAVDEATFFASIEAAGLRAAKQNGFEDGVNGVRVVVEPDYRPPNTNQQNYVRVSITAPKPSYFIQLVYPEPLEVTSSGIGYCQPSHQSLLPPNSAIIAFRSTSACNMGNGEAIGNTGSSEIYVHNSGIFSNSNSSCAIMGRGSSTFIVEGPCQAVGQFDGSKLQCDSEVENLSPLASMNPLHNLPRPACVPGEHYTASGAAPGTYDSWDIKGEFHLERGVYCVREIKMNAKGHLTGEGVILYMPPGNKGIRINGQGSGNLSAPTRENCIENVTCDWIGLLIWSDVNSPNGDVVENGPIHMNGGSEDTWRGMVYAPGSECTMEGNQEAQFHGVYACYSVRGAGTQLLNVWYEFPEFLNMPPKISITE